MIDRRILTIAATIAAASMASVSLAQRTPYLAPQGTKVAPKRIAGIKRVIENGQVRYRMTTPWMEYKDNPVKPALSTTVGVDHLEFIFDGTGAIVPDENPAYTGNCALGGSRYFFGPTAVNAYTYDDMKCAAGTGGAMADRYVPTWYMAVTEQLFLLFFTTEDFVDLTGDPNDPLQVNAFDGVVYDFGSVPAGGYYYSDIDLSTGTLRHELPADENGGNITIFASAYDSGTGQATLGSAGQPMLWFTKIGNPSYLRGEFQWDDDAPKDGTFANPAEYYSYNAPGTCPAIAPDEILGTAFALLVPGSAPEVVVPSSFTTVLGRLDAGDVASLSADDDNYLRHCKFIVPNALVAPVRVRVNGTTTKTSTTGIAAACKGKMQSGGSFSLGVEQRNFVSGLNQDLATGAVGTSEVTVTSNTTGTHSEMIGTAGALQAEYLVRQTGPSVVSLWCFNADHFTWTVN